MNARQASIALSFIALVGCAARPAGPSRLEQLQTLSRQQVASMARSNLNALRSNPKLDLIVEAQVIVASGLKDPMSPQWRSLRLVRTPDGPVVCGQVNGKNSYGGYVGFKRFVGGVDNSVIEQQQDARFPTISDAANAGLFETCGPGE